jgi:hypothetical protein
MYHVVMWFVCSFFCENSAGIERMTLKTITQHLTRFCLILEDLFIHRVSVLYHRLRT